jgi:hypothetical protein
MDTVLIAVSARWSRESTTLHLFSIPSSIPLDKRGRLIQDYLDVQFPHCPELSWQEVAAVELGVVNTITLGITSLPKAV